MRRAFSLWLIFAAAGCTPGAPPAGRGGASAAAVTIEVSLTSSTVAATPYGSSGGYLPALTTVSPGTTVQFVNRDSFAHTASALAGAAFPAQSPLDASALNAGGTTLSGGWSTGALAPGAASPVLVADRTGTYLYGCFYHYGAPMRGAIIVR